ncbi:MAG: hypothetical protein UR93_C0005G0009 [Berkelbacteria bacterium GW2011_GWA2_35_9]|uniref:Uncharacterized protein n=1 Tax=Berkelbacteria bacterium GW2011_GWA2_35_9 TaxID=1618333 RepID=A0A0G0D6N2_9BACT|nr:MAG: hypothetical protein UR93_C0005G0009 [Berkelbacteria bacterium GW2011_GWA2_35_9]
MSIKIEKEDLKICLFWFLALLIVFINIIYYRYNHKYYQEYLSKVLAIHDKYEDIINLALQKNEDLITKETSEIKFSEDTTNRIYKYLNSGENGSKIVEDNNNCQEYEKPWRKITDHSTCAYVLTKAVGDLNFLIVQLIPQDVDQENEIIKKYIEALNSEQEKIKLPGSEISNPTFRYIKTYYEAQAKRFNADLTVNLTVKEPIKIDEKLPQLTASNRDEAIGEWGISDNFMIKNFKKQNIDIRDYDAIGVVVYAPNDIGALLVSHSLSSVRSSLTWLFPNQWGIHIGTLVHEMAHSLGASDQYIIGGDINKPCQDGTFDETITGNHYSLMCNSGSVDLDSNYSSLINKRTAKEMGWINE